MHRASESGALSLKVIIIMAAITLMIGYGVYLHQKAQNETAADNIVSAALTLAQEEKGKLDALAESEEEDETFAPTSKLRRGGYAFTTTERSTPALVQVETENSVISSGVCQALKLKFKESQWRDVFESVYILDKLGNEERNLLARKCPVESIVALRFYVRFEQPKDQQVKSDPDEKQTPARPVPVIGPVASSSSAASSSYSSPSAAREAPRSSSSSSRTSSCPSGTSPRGAGGLATSGCRCNNAGEIWNGSSCRAANCPQGSSRNDSSTGDKTNVPGCRCNPSTPSWSGGRCVAKCPANKVFDAKAGECVCPVNMRAKKGASDVCVECNETSDCGSGSLCVNNKCTGNGKDDNDCRWGVCQTCTGGNVRQNIPYRQNCEVAGLAGVCNENGTCYPTEGRRCASIRGCPQGQFCNYGGTFNSSRKQHGRFGQTANVCQNVEPLQFSYKDVTYFYNSKKDLQSWCRAANNKPNCLWGYLSKVGAESWCASLGKRLLTRAEMESVWDVLRKELPQTYKGYAYWVQEGAWLEDKQGNLSFGMAHPDGYGGRGGVVCR